MFALLEHLQLIQPSMATFSLGTGLMLGAFVGAMLPARMPSGWQG